MRALSLWNNRRGDLMSQFDDFFREFERDFAPALSTKTSFGDFAPALDIEEKDDNYFVTVDLPGLKKEDIKIDLQNSVLTISGERTREMKGEGRYSERAYGRFQRSFTLPQQVDVEKIEARFEDGVLHVTLPKAETAKARAIKVQ